MKNKNVDFRTFFKKLNETEKINEEDIIKGENFEEVLKLNTTDNIIKIAQQNKEFKNKVIEKIKSGELEKLVGKAKSDLIKYKIGVSEGILNYRVGGFRKLYENLVMKDFKKLYEKEEEEDDNESEIENNEEESSTVNTGNDEIEKEENFNLIQDVIVKICEISDIIKDELLNLIKNEESEIYNILPMDVIKNIESRLESEGEYEDEEEEEYEKEGENEGEEGESEEEIKESLVEKKLSYKEKARIPKSEFALPIKETERQKKTPGGVKGKYPIHDRAHAINALARAKQMLKKGKLTKSEYNTIVRKVKDKYPDLPFFKKQKD